MVEGASIIIGVTVLFVAFVLWVCWLIDRKGQPSGAETGDGINPQALSDWRIANKERFK